MKKAGDFFTKDIPKKNKMNLSLCCDMIRFGMMSTLPNFQDEYFEYGENISTKVLAIGGYKPAFLADLVASFLFKMCEKEFEEVKDKGIYRDDGICYFKGKKCTLKIKDWRDRFQARVNEIAFARSNTMKLAPHTTSNK